MAHRIYSKKYYQYQTLWIILLISQKGLQYRVINYFLDFVFKLAIKELWSHHRLAAPILNSPEFKSSRIYTGKTFVFCRDFISPGLSFILKSCLNQNIAKLLLVAKETFYKVRNLFTKLL